MSEICMQEFDRSIRRDKHVYFYCRFVDDIIAICIDDPTNVMKNIRNNLEALGLRINQKKLV